QMGAGWNFCVTQHRSGVALGENLRLLGVEVVDQVLNVLLAEANAEPVVVEDDDVAHRHSLPPVEEGGASANAAERRDLELAEVAALAGDPADAGVGSLV